MLDSSENSILVCILSLILEPFFFFGVSFLIFKELVCLNQIVKKRNKRKGKRKEDMIAGLEWLIEEREL